MNRLNRRNFVKNASVGMATLGLSDFPSKDIRKKELYSYGAREVFIASLTMKDIQGENIEQVVKSAITQMEIALPMSPDIYCFPEVFHVAGIKNERPSLDVSAEDGSGNIIEPFQVFAKKNKCYVICPIYTTESGKYFNAAVIIDRNGDYVGEYRKSCLTEGEHRMGLSPGPVDIPVFNLDFGRIGIQICFDIEWNDGWNTLSKKGAEIVFFPSAFSAGKRVNAKALEYRYCVVSSTRDGRSKICDVGGELASSGGHSSNNWGVLGHLNLERVILHTHSAGTVFVKFPEIREKYGRKVDFHLMGEEYYTILESLSPDLKIKDVVKEFNLRTYQEHLEIAEKFKTGI